MLKVLLKKQLSEVFKGYFYDAKKNKMRSKWAIAGWFVFFVLVMVGMLGGIFTGLSLSICSALCGVGMGWLYFLLMTMIAVVIGAFGSVFNTYAGLYLARDNDLLLSLPIPVRTIMAARLLNVYVMGAMYAATALLPALIVYWVTAGITAARAVCALLLLLISTVFVLLLSCLLGWLMARISRRLKNKSVITTLCALVGVGLYYFVYFRANDFIRELVANAESYGERIRGGARILYFFGRIGEGDVLSAVLFTLALALCAYLLWRAMARSYLDMAAAGEPGGKRRYVEKTARVRSPFAAFLSKELRRFTSSANYMLNCGLGVLLLPAGGVLLLIKGRTLFATLQSVFVARPGSAELLVCALLCMLCSMNDTSAPSVSLEGKSLWLPQSLPVEAKTVLRAKAAAQLLLTEPPLLFAGACAALIVDSPLLARVLILLLPMSFAAFSALSGVAVGLKMPLLHWTNELAPIKQSGAVAIMLFGSWGAVVALAGGYLAIGYKLGAAVYLLLWTALFSALSLWLLRWLDSKGAAAFDGL